MHAFVHENTLATYCFPANSEVSTYLQGTLVCLDWGSDVIRSQCLTLLKHGGVGSEVKNRIMASCQRPI